MKILINASACVGHARCNAIAAALFTLDKNGYNTLAAIVEVPQGMEELARRSVRACPERVLTLVDDATTNPAD